MTIVMMGQPGLFPWWGTFAKAAATDIVIHLDHVSWQKGGYLNRFRLADSSRTTWCTVPLRRPALGTPIIDVEIEPPRRSLRTHRAILEDRVSMIDADARDLLTRLYAAAGTTSASELAIASTEQAAAYLGIVPRFVRSSGLDPQHRSSEMILGLLRNVGADAYLFGPGRHGIAQHYLDVSLLQRNGIRVGLASYATHPRVSILQDIGERGRAAMDDRTISIEWLR